MIAAGLQCGFGAPLGPVLDELRALGFTIIRLDLQESTQQDTTALAQEVLDAGLQPLCIIRRPEQILVIPEGALIEVGNEPDLEHFGWTVEEYIEVGTACVELALKHHRRLYLGVVSNLNPRGFNFLRKLPWDEWVGDGICCSIHRYPDGHSPHNPHDGSATREEEVATLRSIVGDRPLACTEVGYHEVEWSQAEVADNMAWERQFFEAQGFEIISGYQLNDGFGTEPIDKFGFRRMDGTWKPVAFAFANTSFPPLEGLVITLQSDHGQFLTTAQNQTVSASAPAPAPWEHFQVEMLGGNKCALRSWQWHYLTAELDDSVNARATKIAEWETWTFEETTDKRIAFKSDHGKYLTADLDGTVKARAVEIGPWECWTSDPPNWWVIPTAKPNLNRLHGPLTRYNRVVYDGGGIQTMSLIGTREPIRQPRILMFCHAMELFSAWCHGREREVTEQCIAIARVYAGIRVLDVLGYWDVAWRGREVTPIPFVNHSGGIVPATPRYWEQKATFLAMLHKLGLMVMDDRGDMNTWGRSEKIDHMRRNGELYAGLPFGKEVLAGVWSANEGWQNGGDSIALCQDMLRAFESGSGGWLPALRGLSAPGGDSDPLRLSNCQPPMTEWQPEAPCSFVNWAADPATVLTIHGNRGPHEHIIEHYFAYGYDDTMRRTNKVPFNTEPVGPGNGVSVGRVNDPELLCGLTVGALIGGQCWTYMSGFGVFWNGPIDSQPGFEEVARLTKFLPQDIASWPTVCHAGERFRGTRILAANDPTRADQAIAPDGRFAMVIHTQEAEGRPLTCERACQEFTIVNMLTGQTEREGQLNAGSSYRHPGIARLAVGKLA